LAIWYMDDGSFTLRSKGLQQHTAGGSGRIQFGIEALSEGSRDRLVTYLRDTHGLDVSWRAVSKAQQAVLTFTTEASVRFMELVAPYVHPSMDHKLLPRLAGRFAVEPELVEPTQKLVPARILDIHVKPRTGSMHRFDIEVEGSHNYLVDGVMVHNSPETTTGGKALKFYASVRLDIRRIESLKDGTDFVGNRTRVKVVKNKCLAEGTRVFDPVTGQTHTIDEIADGQLPVHVVAARKDGILETRQVRSWFDQGEQTVIGLRVDGGAELWVTPDHKIMTPEGWREASQLTAGNSVARPREFLGFGADEPVPAEQARLLGYLIGDGYVGGSTPAQFINIQQSLHDDVRQIVSRLGCDVHPQGDITVNISHRRGEANGVIALCRWAGIWGHLAPTKQIPAAFFSPTVSAEVVGNLLFGLFETDGWVGREQTGAIRVGYATTSERLAHQMHWLLLRWGIGSSVRRREPRVQRGGLVHGRRIQGKLPSWEVRVAGVDNVTAFADAVPMWGPRGQVLVKALREMSGRHRGSQRNYLSESLVEPVLSRLRATGVSPTFVAQALGVDPLKAASGFRQLLGTPRLRRDRLQTLADALDDAFLNEILADQLTYLKVREVLPARMTRTFDVEVDELHNLVAEDILVHNCAPPFKQAEFDIMYGQGISREGGLIDVGVDAGLVRKAGAWYTYEGDQLGQGKENARTFLRDNPDLANELEKRILEQLGIGAHVDDDEPPEPTNVDF
ncbi:MAG: hypothetical protein M3O94_08160, partial [Actinomycetota bacterium]|nr:hypothetical protein [Actinomycetota bacterium]